MPFVTARALPLHIFISVDSFLIVKHIWLSLIPVWQVTLLSAMALHERMQSHRAASCSQVPALFFTRQTSAHSFAARRQPGHVPRRDLIPTFASVEGDAIEAPTVSLPVTATYAQTASVPVDDDLVVTRFIAETLLPTRLGKYRLRGYKHSVRSMYGLFR